MIQFVFNQRTRRGMTRRQWLRIGGLAGLGMTSLFGKPSIASEDARKLPGFGRAKSVILVYASGGQSQLETWDPKPDAPLDVRGEFQAISSSVPGIALCEHLPRVARLADRLTIIRSMSHEDLDHGSATYLSLTGQYHKRRSSNPPPAPDDLPTYGAILRRARPTHRFVYDAIHVNGPALVPIEIGPGQDAGLLGREFEPLVVGDVTRDAIAIPGLAAQPNLSTARHDARRSLKEQLDGLSRRLDANRKARDMQQLHQTAFEMLSSSRYRDAFDLSAEPQELRDRYGRHRSGQACLLARRLVEAGVPLITVIWNHSNRGQDQTPDETSEYGWDTHNDIFNALKNHLLPRFDESFSALLEDLDDRGLLDETLVVCLGEFGRAPRVAYEATFAGRSPGRKHWASAYSIVMAGAGVKRGAVVGASDRLGASPVTERYGPWDVAATMFSALGVDPRGHYLDKLQRPQPICVGRPIVPVYQG